MCVRAGRCGVHTLFFLALVSVFSLLAVLFMCVRVCVVRPFGALPRIVNILARRTVVSSWLVNVRLFDFSLFPLCPWPPHTFCAFVEFFFLFFFSRRSGPMEEKNMGDIWLWFVFAGVPFDVRGGSSFFFFFFFFFFFCVRCCPLGALLRNILGFLIHVYVAVDTICMTHGAVTYLVAIPRFPVVRGRVFFVCGLVFLFLLRFLLSFFFFFFFFFFFDTHLSPSSYGTHFARWLGARFVLVFVVVACWFLVFASFLLLCLWSAHKSLGKEAYNIFSNQNIFPINNIVIHL